MKKLLWKKVKIIGVVAAVCIITFLAYLIKYGFQLDTILILVMSLFIIIGLVISLKKL